MELLRLLPFASFASNHEYYEIQPCRYIDHHASLTSLKILSI